MSAKRIRKMTQTQISMQLNFLLITPHLAVAWTLELIGIFSTMKPRRY